MTIAPPPKKMRKPPVVEESKTGKKAEVSPRKSSVDIDSKAMRDFLKQAPQGQDKDLSSRWKLKGKKVVITVQIDPEMLEQFDELAESLGQSRPALIRTLIKQALVKTSGGI